MVTEGTGERPQDVGRRHRRKATPTPETRALLDRYQAAMRAELGAILDALDATAVPGLLPDAPPSPAIPLDDPRRSALWTRAITLGRELGTAIDLPPAEKGAAVAGPRRRGRVDYGGA